MKFKIDENLPVEIADILKSVNYDAVTVIDQGLRSARDNTIINVCLEEERILITLDLEFHLTHLRLFRLHNCSLVNVPLINEDF